MMITDTKQIEAAAIDHVRRLLNADPVNVLDCCVHCGVYIYRTDRDRHADDCPYVAAKTFIDTLDWGMRPRDDA